MDDRPIAEIPVNELTGCTLIRVCDKARFTLLGLIPPAEGGGLLRQPRWVITSKDNPTNIHKIEYDKLAANYIIMPPDRYKHLLEN